MALPCMLEASTRVLQRAMDNKASGFRPSMSAMEEHMTLSSISMKETSRMAYGTAMAKFNTAMALDTKGNSV